MSTLPDYGDYLEPDTQSSASRWRRQTRQRVLALAAVASLMHTSASSGRPYHKLADSQRRGGAEDRARRRLGIERIELTDDDIARIDRLGQPGSVAELARELPPDQQEAIQAHVIEERGYGEIAAELETSEAVVRKRVSRGLAAIRRRLGGVW